MFNFEGRSRIYTLPGVVWSLFLYVAILSLIVDRTASFWDRSVDLDGIGSATKVAKLLHYVHA